MICPSGFGRPSSPRVLSTAALARRNLPTLRNRVVYAADGSRAWTLCSPEEEFESLSPTPDDLPPG